MKKGITLISLFLIIGLSACSDNAMPTSSVPAEEMTAPVWSSMQVESTLLPVEQPEAETTEDSQLRNRPYEIRRMLENIPHPGIERSGFSTYHNPIAASETGTEIANFISGMNGFWGPPSRSFAHPGEAPADFVFWASHQATSVLQWSEPDLTQVATYHPELDPFLIDVDSLRLHEHIEKTAQVLFGQQLELQPRFGHFTFEFDETFAYGNSFYNIGNARQVPIVLYYEEIGDGVYQVICVFMWMYKGTLLDANGGLIQEEELIDYLLAVQLRHTITLRRNVDSELYYHAHTLPSFADLLIAHHELLTNDIDEVPIPPGYSFQAHWNAAGDLTGNGLNDLAILINEHDPNPYGPNPISRRHLYILLALSGGGYELGWHSGDIMLPPRMAGRFGDGFIGMEIEDGVLSIEHVFGSAASGRDIVSYGIRDGELILVREEVTAWHSTIGNNHTTIYHPESGIVEIFTYLQDKDSRMWNKGQRQMLFSHTTLPGQVYEFSHDAHRQGDTPSLGRGWRDNTEWQHVTLLFATIVDAMYSSRPFGSRIIDESNINASEALTLVRDEHYPELERVEFLLSAENMESFDIIAGYHVSRHFYTDGVQILIHSSSTQNEYTSAVHHSFQLLEPEITRFGRRNSTTASGTVDSETGEITIR